jgi:hypothetical protein
MTFVSVMNLDLPAGYRHTHYRQDTGEHTQRLPFVGCDITEYPERTRYAAFSHG